MGSYAFALTNVEILHSFLLSSQEAEWIGVLVVIGPLLGLLD